MIFSGLDLTMPQSFLEATDKEIEEKTGGCGPGKYGDYFVPDTILFVSIKEACVIHDWEYSFAESFEDKKNADMNFLMNMLNINYNRSKSKVMRRIRDQIIFKYFISVYYYGDPFFKNVLK